MKKISSIFFAALLVLNILGTLHLYSRLNSLNENEYLILNDLTQSVSFKQMLHHEIKDYIEFENRQRKTEALASLKNEQKLADKSANSRLYGDVNARINIKLFSDLECPFCRKIHNEVKRVVDGSQGIINWEFKHFPLNHHNPSAANQALAVECVASEYDNLTSWVAIDQMIKNTQGNGKGVGDIPTFVRELGLNGKLIELCMNNESLKSKINRDYADGQALGINATPVIEIFNQSNGKKVLLSGFKSAEELLTQINQAIL